MADTPTTTDTTAPAATVTTDPPVTPPAQVQAPAKTFTQEEVDQIVKARLERERGQRKQEPAPKPTPAPTAAPNDQTFTREEWEREADRREEFARATANLDPKQVSFLRTAMKAANPSDVTTWCEEAKTTMGLGKQPAPPVVQPAASAAPATTASAEPAKPPAAAPSAPTATALPTVQGVPDIFNMTRPQLMAAGGPAFVRENLERLWKIGNQMSGAPPRPKLPGQRTQ